MVDAKYVERWGPGPHEAADAAVFRVADRAVLLVLRDDDSWALPGGFLEPGESHSRAAVRELREETGLRLLEDEYSHRVRRDDEERDPRAWVRTWAYSFVMAGAPIVEAADDAREARWWPLLALPERMYADHRGIVEELAGMHPLLRSSTSGGDADELIENRN